MVCPNCGFENESGTRFCRQCGTPQNEAPQQSAPPQPAYTQPPYTPPQPAYNQPPYTPSQPAYTQPPYTPPQPAYTQPPYTPPQPAYNQSEYAPSVVQPEAPKKKSKTGLIIGICAGVVVIAVAVVLVLLLSGPNVAGDWISADDGIVLSVDKDGELTIYSLAGSEKADYDFDKGSGSFDAGDVEYEFTVDKDELQLTNTDTDDKFELTRADKEPDIREVVTAPLIGLWTNDSNGEVLEFKGYGEASTHSPDGDFDAIFEFDVKNGEGTFKVLENEFVFTCDGETMTLESIGAYQKVDDSFDIATFVSEHSNPLISIWYDQAGVYGTIEFFNDNTYTMVIYGVTTNGTYTYDSAAGTGEMTSELGLSGTFSYAAGTLTFDGATYTKDYVEQQTAPDYSALIGNWYESTTGGSVSFSEEGTFNVFLGGNYYYGSYTFDPVSQEGTISTDTNETLNFYISSGSLYLEGVEFTRDYAAVSSGVEGYWYDIDGEVGTIFFYTDGSLEIYSYGTYVYGTYTYDAASNTGNLSLEYENKTYESSYYIASGLLVVDDVYYTRDYVEQPSY